MNPIEKQKIELAFCEYLKIIGYDKQVSTVTISANERGVEAKIYGHDVKLKYFTQIEREGELTRVRLSVLDFNNNSITGGLFIIESAENIFKN